MHVLKIRQKVCKVYLSEAVMRLAVVSIYIYRERDIDRYKDFHIYIYILVNMHVFQIRQKVSKVYLSEAVMRLAVVSAHGAGLHGVDGVVRVLGQHHGVPPLLPPSKQE